MRTACRAALGSWHQGNMMAKSWSSQFSAIPRILSISLNRSASVPARMRAVDVKPGNGDAQHLVVKDVTRPKAPQDGYLVRVHATAINRADILQRQGKYPPPPGASPLLGLEIAGEISHVGPFTSTPKYKVGDRVCALLAGGGYAQYASVEEGLLMPIPPSLSFTQAAAIPEVFLTAYQALYYHAKINHLGPISPSRTILIQAGGSGVGTAAIQLAKFHHPKNIIIATAGSEEKCKKCIALGAHGAVNYKEHWAIKLPDLTNKKGFDIVVDCVGGPFFDLHLHLMNSQGTLVLVGFMGGSFVTKASLLPIWSKNLTITSSTLRPRPLAYKQELISKFMADCWGAFETGKLRPIVDKIFPMKDVIEAHTYVENRHNFGKVVMTVE